MWPNVHNASVNIPVDKLNQLRYYSDASEFARNFTKTMPARAIGGSALMGGILQQLNQTVATNGQQKMTLFFGSYQTFFAFFGLANLTDVSPDFQSCLNNTNSLAFELYADANMATFPSNTNDLRVRFLFKNGTDGALTQVLLFDRKDTTLSLADFQTEIIAHAIKSSSTWCSRCNTTAGFCSPRVIAPDYTFASPLTTDYPRASCNRNRN